MKKIIFIFVILFSINSHAEKWGFVGGFNYADGDYDANGVSLNFDSDLGFQLGLRYIKPYENFDLRTGAVIIQYNAELSTIGFDADFSATQLKFPVTAQKMLNEFLGVFGGAALSLHLSDDYTINQGFGADPDVNGLFFALEIGASVAFNEQFSGEFFYDIGINEFADDTDASMYGFQIVYFFK